ncbi:MAG: MipA/OmpV family protein [Pseudomonadota bacterium]|nr:MipA/OmpV family protein [Pseudomonadota bacterium]
MAYSGTSVDVPTSAQAGGFVGLGVAVKPDYEGSDDYEAAPAPFGHYRWASGRYVDLGGTGGAESAGRLSLNIISSDWSRTWEVGPLLQYRLERDDVDNNQVDDMKKVDDAIELGAFVGLRSGHWSTELAFAGDVSDEHDGYLVYLKGAYDWPVNDSFLLQIGAHGTWADSNYMDTYFGVDKNNRGRSTLPDYNADSGIKDAGLDLTGIYHFNKKWGMVGSVGWTRMFGDAEDSPLVDGGSRAVGDENQYRGVLAVTYSF